MSSFDNIVFCIDSYLNSKNFESKSEVFCNEYMDMYYNLSEELEQTVTDAYFEVLDDINWLCDSYENDSNIREGDPNCIDAIKLFEKLSVLRQKLR